MISRRDAEATRAKAEALGLTFPIVMQRQWEISLKYGMFATPIGYLIDEQGIIVKDVAVGVEPILALTNEPATAVAERVRPFTERRQHWPPDRTAVIANRFPSNWRGANHDPSH